MLNNTIFFSLYNLSHHSVFFDKVSSFTAHILPYLVILGAFIFLLFHHDIIKSKNPFAELIKKWKEVSIAFFSGASAWVVATIIKIIVKAPRPYLVFPDISPLLSKTDFSFPSGHATFFMALGVAIYLSHKKAGVIFIILALLIGLARIITGVHFPKDIFAGFIIGIVIAIIFNRIFIKK